MSNYHLNLAQLTDTSADFVSKSLEQQVASLSKHWPLVAQAIKPELLEQITNLYASFADFSPLTSASKKPAHLPVTPPAPLIFRAFTDYGPEEVQVVIIGQDPYPNVHACGLAFATHWHNSTPASLRNIYKSVESYLGYTPQPTLETIKLSTSTDRATGVGAGAGTGVGTGTDTSTVTGDENQATQQVVSHLLHWHQQGVWLLNAALTFDDNKVLTIKDWHPVVAAALSQVNQQERPIAVLLWGNHAQKYRQYFTNEKFLVIECAHPSPLSARHGFFEADCFRKIDEFRQQQGLTPIKW